MKERVFTGRSVSLGLATGMVVSVMLGAFGIDWVLACMTGLAAGAFALAFCTSLDPRFDMTPRRRGPWVIASIVILTPALNLGGALRHAPDTVHPFVISVLILLTGFAAYSLGVIVGALNQIEGDDAPPTANRYRITAAPDDAHPSS